MATNRAMLKEAIADAKAVKETAIANAKAALEEAFAPQVREMLSLKLQEMDAEETNEMYGMSEEEKVYETEDNDADDKMNEVDLEELLAELENEGSLEEDLFEAEESEESEEGEEDEEGGEEPLDIDNMTEEDLKDIIEDVLDELIKQGKVEAGHGEEDEEEEEGEEIETSDEEVDLAELLREIEEMEESKEEVEESVVSWIKDKAKQLTKSPYVKTVEEFLSQKEGKVNRGGKLEMINIQDLVAKAKTGDEQSFKTLKAAFQNYLSGEGIGGSTQNNYIGPFNQIFGKEGEGIYKGGKFTAAAGVPGETIKEMESELAEAYSTIKSLKNELNEINLLNAKLLYSNKIFKAKNLNESQKVKVLSSFDKATTVGEVKMVFETLNEGIKVAKTTIKENLGSASKSTVTPTVKKPIVESNDAFLRMQKLAGLI